MKFERLLIRPVIAPGFIFGRLKSELTAFGLNGSLAPWLERGAPARSENSSARGSQRQNGKVISSGETYQTLPYR
jgi:hypothetical protein